MLVAVLLLTLFAGYLYERFSKKDENRRADGIVIVNGAGAKPSDEPINESGERFCMLSAMDREKEKFGKRKYEQGVSLEYFCESFRNFAAYELKLYYDIEDIRRFVSGLAVSKMLILQGMSGTGKTSLAHALGTFVDNPSVVIPVQPVWKERSDLIGYYNEFTKRFNETLLLEKMYEANYSKDMYVAILDEMNIARVEYYFAEFLSLLELPDPEEFIIHDENGVTTLETMNLDLALKYYNFDVYSMQEWGAPHRQGKPPQVIADERALGRA